MARCLKTIRKMTNTLTWPPSGVNASRKLSIEEQWPAGFRIVGEVEVGGRLAWADLKIGSPPIILTKQCVKLPKLPI